MDDDIDYNELDDSSDGINFDPEELQLDDEGNPIEEGGQLDFESDDYRYLPDYSDDEPVAKNVVVENTTDLEGNSVLSSTGDRKYELLGDDKKDTITDNWLAQHGGTIDGETIGDLIDDYIGKPTPDPIVNITSTFVEELSDVIAETIAQPVDEEMTLESLYHSDMMHEAEMAELSHMTGDELAEYRQAAADMESQFRSRNKGKAKPTGELIGRNEDASGTWNTLTPKGKVPVEGENIDGSISLVGYGMLGQVAGKSMDMVHINGMYTRMIKKITDSQDQHAHSMGGATSASIQQRRFGAMSDVQQVGIRLIAEGRGAEITGMTEGDALAVKSAFEETIGISGEEFAKGMRDPNKQFYKEFPEGLIQPPRHPTDIATVISAMSITATQYEEMGVGGMLAGDIGTTKEEATEMKLAKAFEDLKWLAEQYQDPRSAHAGHRGRLENETERALFMRIVGQRSYDDFAASVIPMTNELGISGLKPTQGNWMSNGGTGYGRMEASSKFDHLYLTRPTLPGHPTEYVRDERGFRIFKREVSKKERAAAMVYTPNIKNTFFPVDVKAMEKRGADQFEIENAKLQASVDAENFMRISGTVRRVLREAFPNTRNETEHSVYTLGWDSNSEEYRAWESQLNEAFLAGMDTGSDAEDAGPSTTVGQVNDPKTIPVMLDPEMLDPNYSVTIEEALMALNVPDVDGVGGYSRMDNGESVPLDKGNIVMHPNPRAPDMSYLHDENKMWLHENARDTNKYNSSANRPDIFKLSRSLEWGAMSPEEKSLLDQAGYGGAFGRAKGEGEWSGHSDMSRFLEDRLGIDEQQAQAIRMDRELTQKWPDQTPEWYAQRYGLATASSVKSVIGGKKAYANLVLKLAQDAHGIKRDDIHANFDMWEGSKHEKRVRANFEKRILSQREGERWEEAFFTKNKLYPGMGASPDGLIFDADNNLVGLTEFKLVRTGDMSKQRNQYYDQMQFQMAITGAKQVDFFALHRYTNKYVHEIVEANPEYQKKLTDRVAEAIAAAAQISEEGAKQLTTQISSKDTEAQPFAGPMPMSEEAMQAMFDPAEQPDELNKVESATLSDLTVRTGKRTQTPEFKRGKKEAEYRSQWDAAIKINNNMDNAVIRKEAKQKAMEMAKSNKELQEFNKNLNKTSQTLVKMAEGIMNISDEGFKTSRATVAQGFSSEEQFRGLEEQYARQGYSQEQTTSLISPFAKLAEQARDPQQRGGVLTALNKLAVVFPEIGPRDLPTGDQIADWQTEDSMAFMADLFSDKGIPKERAGEFMVTSLGEGARGNAIMMTNEWESGANIRDAKGTYDNEAQSAASRGIGDGRMEWKQFRESALGIVPEEVYSALPWAANLGAPAALLAGGVAVAAGAPVLAAAGIATGAVVGAGFVGSLIGDWMDGDETIDSAVPKTSIRQDGTPQITNVNKNQNDVSIVINNDPKLTKVEAEVNNESYTQLK